MNKWYTMGSYTAIQKIKGEKPTQIGSPTQVTLSKEKTRTVGR